MESIEGTGGLDPAPESRFNGVMNESMQTVSLIIMLVGAMVVAGIAVKALCARLAVPALIGYFALGFALRLADARLGLLSPAALNAFEFLANAGVVVLLFRVGLESDLGKLIRQRFLSVHATIYNHFNIQRHLISRKYHRLFRMAAMEAWRHVTIPA